MNFSVEEENLICMYHTSDRRRTMARMLAARPDMDTEMRQLTKGTIAKLERMTDADFDGQRFDFTTILNRHEEFRTALDKNGQVGVFSEMLPCYTIFHKETETFSSIWTEFTADYTEFLQNYQKDIDAYGERKGMFAKPNPPENTFPVSMIPWTSFEGFNLNLKKGYDYLLPIFTFGKYYEDGGKYYIPLSIQVHHAVCDGFHVCRFLDELQDLLNK